MKVFAFTLCFHTLAQKSVPIKPAATDPLRLAMAQQAYQKAGGGAAGQRAYDAVMHPPSVQTQVNLAPKTEVAGHKDTMHENGPAANTDAAGSKPKDDALLVTMAQQAYQRAGGGVAGQRAYDLIMHPHQPEKAATKEEVQLPQKTEVAGFRGYEDAGK